MKNIWITVIVSLGFAACKPATEITGSWKNTSTSASEENYDTILVTALTARTNARQTVENDMVAALEQKGFRTLKSIEVTEREFAGRVFDLYDADKRVHRSLRI